MCYILIWVLVLEVCIFIFPKAGSIGLPHYEIIVLVSFDPLIRLATFSVDYSNYCYSHLRERCRSLIGFPQQFFCNSLSYNKGFAIATRYFIS